MKSILFTLFAPLLFLTMSSDVSAQDPMEIAEGAKLWSNNCMRCHNARSPMERNDRAWATIALHMRARSNLTKSEVRAVKVYVQMMNAPEVPMQAPAQADEVAQTTPKQSVESDEPPGAQKPDK